MLLALMAISLLTFAEERPSVEQQFAAYHQSLSGAADDLLTAPAQPLETAKKDVATPVASSSANNRFGSALMRVQQLRPLLEPVLREHGVPTDLAAVVLVESGGRSTALSPKGALGLWQLMPETARRYGLTVSPSKDERFDTIKATRAAARYLRDLYAQFGDWQLAFAAYNAGEQAVQRAMLRTGSSDFARVTRFLPNETRAYVPAVMTARPLFCRGHDNASTVLAARRAHVLYASARLEN
jgi:soluble lytic murein transglycosylase-like protein